MLVRDYGNLLKRVWGTNDSNIPLENIRIIYKACWESVDGISGQICATAATVSLKSKQDAETINCNYANKPTTRPLTIDSKTQETRRSLFGEPIISRAENTGVKYKEYINPKVQSHATRPNMSAQPDPWSTQSAANHVRNCATNRGTVPNPTKATKSTRIEEVNKTIVSRWRVEGNLFEDNYSNQPHAKHVGRCRCGKQTTLDT